MYRRRTKTMFHRPPKVTSTVLAVLGTAMVVFVVSASTVYSNLTALWWNRLWPHAELWRLVTSLIWFGPADQVHIIEFLGAGAAIWLLGSQLERWWGPKRLVIFIFTSGILANLAAAVTAALWWPGQPAGGPGPIGFALATAAAAIFWSRGMPFSMMGRVLVLKGRHLGIFLAIVLPVSAVIDVISGRPLIRHASDLVGAAIALLFVTQSWRPWVLMQRRRSRRLKDLDVIEFPKNRRPSNRTHDPYRWN